MSTNFETLADRIREEAAQASRSGQMARLEAIAEEVEALRRGAKTLGHIVEQQGRMVLDATGLHHFVGEDGDGDWGAVWDSLYDFRANALREAADSVDFSSYYDPTPTGGVSTSCHLAENAARDWLARHATNPRADRDRLAADDAARAAGGAA